MKIYPLQRSIQFVFALILLTCSFHPATAQDSSATKEKVYKNVVRYNLSSALLFGFDKYIVFGYERVIAPRQSMSINVGRASLPKIVSFSTDSFALSSDRKNTGFNVSLDYRFYLAKENKYRPPHGLYIGPYVAYSNVERTNDWNYKGTNNNTPQLISTGTTFNFFTVGGELGYQFILWKRLSLDFVLVGPGLTSYKIKANIASNLSDENKQRLQDAIKEVITQRFPGMNYVMSDERFDANGSIGSWNIGYRYLIHIGFVF